MRAFRWMIITVAVLVLLAGVGIAASAAWLNNYIRSDAFRHEVEARAGQSIGGTVRVQSVSFDIFSGLKLQGLATQIDPKHAGGRGAVLVTVENVKCTYAWRELLNRHLKLTGIALDKPQFVLTKQAVQPALSAMPEFAAPMPNGAAAPVSPSASTPSGPVSSGPGDAPSNQATGIAMPFQFTLDHAKVNDGTVSMRDAAGASMVELQGVNAQADTSGYAEGKEVTGTLKITDLALPSNMHAVNFSTPVTYQGGTLDAKPMEAEVFGGRLAGGYHFQLFQLSVLDLNGKGLDMAQLTAATNSNSAAKLSGSLDLQSKWRGVETGDVAGEGDAQLANGKLEGVKILQDLSQILRINELNAPAFTKAQTHFQVTNRQTTFTGLQIESRIFKITGGGVIGFNGSLQADLVLVLSREALAKMPSEITASFVQQQDGSGSIGFKVSGTTAQPQTDLPARLLMQNTKIQNVINKALNKFFH